MKQLLGILRDGVGRVRYERARVHIAESWSGYLEIADACGVIAGQRYRLALEDGRAGEILVKGLQIGERGTIRVNF
jgi:hypothetical protein